MKKSYPGWVWRSYDVRPTWAEEASIDEWASHVQGELSAGRPVNIPREDADIAARKRALI